MEITKWINHASINENAKINLICFPHAGGTSTYFANWVMKFSDNVNVLPVQYPMREQRFNEQMPNSINELAKNMVEENKELFTSPFALFGHCSGSIVAYEVARYAELIYSAQPEYLFVSASASPARFEMQQLSSLSDDEFKKCICEYGYADKSLLEDEMIIEYFLPIVKKDFELQENYKCLNPHKVGCRIQAINGKDDTNVNVGDKIEDWRRFTQSGFESISYSGSHFYLDNHMEEICEMIEDKLFKYILS